MEGEKTRTLEPRLGIDGFSAAVEFERFAAAEMHAMRIASFGAERGFFM
jgi:hypothetical protein